MSEIVFLDSTAMEASIGELADGLAAHVEGFASPEDSAAIVGIKRGGALLAARVRDRIRETRGWNLPLGELDITLYRDDLSQNSPNPIVRGTSLDFDVDGRTILLVDDVLYTGRTIRSAMDEIVDFGRPAAIRLGVLIDRGGREYPIRADVAPVVKAIPEGKVVRILFRETQGRDEALLADR